MLEQSVPQMKQKGRLQVGKDADVVVFDLATVSDKATFTAPNQRSVGMKHVVVNGVPVIRDGELVRGALPGKAIRRAVVR
jgi:N-acyl-D-glutamate deacylase